MRPFTFVACVALAVLATACGDNLPGNQPPTVGDLQVTTPEDTPIQINVTATAADPDEDELTFEFTAPAHGTITAAGGVVTYRPEDDYHGADALEVTVSDGTASATATISITISPVNDAPVAVDDTMAAAEDTAATVSAASLVANDLDVDGDALTVTEVGNAQNGTVALAGGTVTFTPAQDFTGDATFEYTVSDGELTDVGTVTVTVDGENDPPVGGDDAVTTDEDVPATISAATLLANDTDADSTVLTITAVDTAVNGTVDLAGTTITFTPAPDFHGTGSFRYTVSDGAATDTATVTVTVNPVNDAPVAAAGSATTAEDTAVTITLTGSDVDGDTLTFAIAAGPTAGTLGAITSTGPTAATVVYTPNPDASGTDTFTFTVADASLTSAPATVTVTVTPVADAPVAIAGTATTAEDTAVTITLAGTDADGDALTFAIAAGPTAGTLGAITSTGPTTATVVYTPDADVHGTDTFAFTVNDGTTTSAPATVTVTVTPVNDAPVAVAATATTDEDTAVTITLTGSDVDGDALTFAIDDGPTAGTLGAITSTGPTTATVVYTPNPDVHGADSFTFTVADASLTSAPATVTVTVTPVGDAPVAVAGTASTAEDTAVTITLAGTDADGDALTFAIATGPTAGTLGAITATGPTTATVVYTPDADVHGTDTFAFTVNDGTTTSAAATVTVTVTPVNDAPVAIAATATTDEDTAVTITLTGSDVDGDVLTFAIAAGPTAGTLGAITSTGPTTATVVYTPNPDVHGADSFTFTVADASATSAPATASITVTPVNDPPLAVAASASVVADESVTITLAGIDVDGDALTFAIATAPGTGTILSGPTQQTATTATVVYGAPAAAGSDTFTFTVDDGDATSPPATVTVTILAVPNSPPVAVDDVDTTDEDVGILRLASVYTANDTDADGDLLTITAVQNPVNGAVILDSGFISFMPTANFFGTASFEYVVTDGIDFDVGVVTITVDPVNDLPVAFDDSFTIEEDTVSPLDVLANDSDIEGPLTVVAVTQPANGSVTFTATHVTYTPAPNFHGDDSFTYTVGDSDDATDSATVSITVTPVNDAPVAQGQALTMPENTTLAVTLTGFDVDVPAQPLTFAVVTPPVSGTLGGTPPALTYTPDADFVGTDSFTFVVNDGVVDSAPATISIVVLNVPVCNDGLIEGDEECDDQGNASGDGCSETCELEDGWDCSGQPTACTEICGDGLVVGGEQCDDDNAVETDGCTTQCVAGVVCDATNPLLAAAERFATDPATGHCYASFDDDQTTFAAAQAECIAAGGHLATITSAEEQALVASVQNPAQNPWIGLTDELVEGSFGWITGEPLGYTNWEPGQPDGGEPEDCVNLFSTAASPSSTAGTWNDTSCTFIGFTAGRICEVESICGDGIVQPDHEACDDGNTDSFDGCSATCQNETLFFSEYVEGTSNNKALEIANPLPTAVNLTGCALRVYFNGNTTVGGTFNLTQTVAAGEVLVVCNSGSAAGLLATCDVPTNSNVLTFNGDDAVELICGGVTIDVIGQIGFDPGTEWGSGVTSTADNTIRRKCSVSRGDPVGNNVFDPAIEWDGFATDTFAGLGGHACFP